MDLPVVSMDANSFCIKELTSPMQFVVCVGMPSWPLCGPRGVGPDDAERRGLHSHAERGNEICCDARLSCSLSVARGFNFCSFPLSASPREPSCHLVPILWAGSPWGLRPRAPTDSVRARLTHTARHLTSLRCSSDREPPGHAGARTVSPDAGRLARTYGQPGDAGIAIAAKSFARPPGNPGG